MQKLLGIRLPKLFWSKEDRLYNSYHKLNMALIDLKMQRREIQNNLEFCKQEYQTEEASNTENIDVNSYASAWKERKKLQEQLLGLTNYEIAGIQDALKKSKKILEGSKMHDPLDSLRRHHFPLPRSDIYDTLFD